MVSLDATQTKSTTKSYSKESSKDDNSTPSFSELLKGIKSKKDLNVVQNSSVVLKKETVDLEEKSKTISPTKNNKFLDLLKSNDDKLEIDIKNDIEISVIEDEDIKDINPKITQTLETKDIKLLINDAKNYLKNQILESDEYKQSQIKDLPKTLKGLTQVAKQLGIDLSKITIEDVTTVKDISKKVINSTSKDEKIDLKTNKKESSSLVLFKPEVTSKLTTQQIVQTKNNVTIKDEKKEAPKLNSLTSLLKGDKVSKDNKISQDDLFASTTKATLTPTKESSSDKIKSLESLLMNDKKDSTNIETPVTSKEQTITTPKADSFEVKVNEAKQMIKYLSQDVKTAIEDYKAPFTRVKVQLNPEKLGEVDVTVVQRGKNLHVNLSSNNTAITTLSQHLAELKTQLQNSGINNATFNFNSSSQNESSAFEQQQQQQQRDAQKEYNYFDNEEQNEEILSSLEIIVPNYA